MRRNSVIVWLIIAACGMVFLWQISLPPAAERDIVLSLGFVPAVLFGTSELAPRLQIVPAWASIVTSMFVHGGWLHILGNMLYLWIFGDNVEDRFGHRGFLIFDVLCGIAAALAQAAFDPHSNIPNLGASGAIAGVLASYLVMFPNRRVNVLLGFIVIPMSALIVIGFWFVLQLLSVGSITNQTGGVAYMAHIGGFVAGLLLTAVFRGGGGTQYYR